MFFLSFVHFLLILQQYFVHFIVPMFTFYSFFIFEHSVGAFLSSRPAFFTFLTESPAYLRPQSSLRAHSCVYFAFVFLRQHCRKIFTFFAVFLFLALCIPHQKQTRRCRSIPVFFITSTQLLLIRHCTGIPIYPAPLPGRSAGRYGW